MSGRFASSHKAVAPSPTRAIPVKRLDLVVVDAHEVASLAAAYADMLAEACGNGVVVSGGLPDGLQPYDLNEMI